MMRSLLRWGSLLCILLFLLCGCTPGVYREYGPVNYWYTADSGKWKSGLKYEVRIDIDFSDEERSQLLQAIKDWNYVLNEQITFKVINFSHPGVLKDNVHAATQGYWFIKTDSTNQGIIKLDEELRKMNKTLSTVAYVNKIGGNLVYFSMDRILTQNLKGIANHEIAHLLGAHHMDKGLMSPVITKDSSICIDRGTIMQVINYHKLDSDRIRWCYLGPISKQPYYR